MDCRRLVGSTKSMEILIIKTSVEMMNSSAVNMGEEKRRHTQAHSLQPNV